MEPLQVLLFGGFQLRYGNGTVPPMPSRAARSLFGYLVVDPGTSHPRERIAAEFWPDLPASRARRRLSHTLWQVQDALGELVGDAPYLRVTTESIGFDRDLPFWVDVSEFESGLDRARAVRAEGELGARGLRELERTVELYRGEFLAGHYDDWIAPEQERLHQRYLEALSWLVVGKKEQGAFEDALVYARRLTNEDPLREDGHREVMRLSVLLGRTSDAIRQYERCAEVLSAELGTSPSPATHQLYERIVRRRPATPVADEEPASPFPERLPLVGRAREREVAIDVLERALGGRGGAVLVEGDPGLGKSRLLAEAVDDAHWRSFLTMHSSCHGPEPMPPYALVQDLLEGVLSPLRVEQLRPRVDEVWLAEAARLVPVLTRALPAGAPTMPALRHVEGAQRMRDALVHVLVALAAIDPVAIVADDLQWADPESLEVLRALASEVADHRLAVLIGYRGDDARDRPQVWGAIRDIDRRLQPERVLLEPLDLTGTSELARVIGRGREVSPAVVEQLHRETGGNPLFLMETLRTLTDNEQLALLETDDPAELPLPGSIRALVASRLERLSRENREVLDLAAVAGEGVDLDLLTDATELPREVVVDAADQLIRTGLLVQEAETLELRHHQVRRATLDELSAGRARALHLRVGQALERARPDAVERLAHHFRGAERPREAMNYLRAAARNAVAVHAYAAADDYLRQAAEQQTRGPVAIGARFELLTERESVLDVLGDRDEQYEVLEEMALLANEDRHLAEVSRRKTMLLAHRGDLEEAIEVGEQAVAQAEGLEDVELLGPALVALGTAQLFAGQNGAAIPILRRAAEATREGAEEAEVRTALANVLFRDQQYEAAVAELERAREVAVECGSPREEARALGVLGSVHTETGDLAQAAELFEDAVARCRSIGFRYGEAVNLLNLGNVLYNQAHLAPALEAYATAIELFDRLGDQRGLAMVRLNRGAVRFEVLGDDSSASEDLELAKAYLSSVGDLPLVAQCCEAQASLAMRAGSLEEAEALVDEGLAAATESGDAWATVYMHQRLAQLHQRRGRLREADSALAEAIRLAVEHDLGSLLAVLHGQEGELLLELGRPEDALAATTVAVGHLRGDERAYTVRYQHHRALAACGEDRRARDELAAARAELVDMLDQLDSVARDRALLVPEHARIVDGGVSQPRNLGHLTVAAVSAPVGRPLRPAELVNVVVDLAPNGDQPDDPVEGRRWLLQHVVDQITAQGGAPTVSDLAELLEVSQATVRRDLASLRARGDAVITRGYRAG